MNGRSRLGPGTGHDELQTIVELCKVYGVCAEKAVERIFMALIAEHKLNKSRCPCYGINVLHLALPSLLWSLK